MTLRYDLSREAFNARERRTTAVRKGREREAVVLILLAGVGMNNDLLRESDTCGERVFLSFFNSKHEEVTLFG